MQWGWKEAILVDQQNELLSIQLVSSTDTANKEQSSTTASTTIVQLPISALESGDLVLANDVDPVTLSVAAPHDLIALTHLHEPSVCLALQHRYASNVIYTNTGPVLLALNPFAAIPGLYGDAVQKQYADAAEQKMTAASSNKAALPPHVYAIADAAFRSMMRALEDAMDDDSNNNTANKNNNLGTSAVKDSSSSRPTPSPPPAAASRRLVNQSILVSGESGSGKTVTTKFVMKYLAALSHRSVQMQESAQQRAYVKATATTTTQTREEQNSGKTWRQKQHFSAAGQAMDIPSAILAGNTIEAQVLQSNPILESFGNARTVRNDNSSRFGKFIEIQFTMSGKLVGAVMQTYLLEKVRLNSQCPGERNYHIFYELLSGGMNQRELSQFFLAPTAGPEDFKLTNACGTVTTRRDGISDRDTYTHLIAALTTMKFAKPDIQDIFSVTAAILHASNLTFTDLPNDSCCLDESNVHLHPVCTLLGLSIDKLNQALCHCFLTAGGTTVTRSLNSAQAVNGLEALLKETYGAMFQYLVQRINGQISAESTNHGDDSQDESKRKSATIYAKNGGVASIGVLDIFGFESFAMNSFEQLCINYCNEALQQQFNAFVLENEQAEYEREGIQWSFIEFPENQDVLDLVEKRGSSILSILDDQCRAPGPSDKAFCLAVYSQCGSLPRFEADRKQQAMLQFSIHHYAGPVEYTVDGFTAKNKDELPKETVELLSGSDVLFVRELAVIMEAAHGDGVGSPGIPPFEHPTPRKLHRVDSSVGRPTVGGQFRSQLKTLRLKIDRTAPHYIRCLKPNDSLVPDHFDTAIVAEQLKCGGILEAVRVARAGFTQHYTHSDFCRRYRTLAWKEMSTIAVVGKGPTQSPHWSSPSVRKAISNRHSYPLPNFIPKTSSNGGNKSKNIAPSKQDLDPAEAKVLCKDLIKVLYKKILQQGVGVDTRNDGGGIGYAAVFDTPSPAAKAKTYTFTTPCKVPSWTKAGSKTSGASFSTSNTGPPLNSGIGSAGQRVSLSPTFSSSTSKVGVEKPVESASPKWKRGSSALTGVDLAKVGIQMGKTKIFLRHKAFEALERIRSMELSMAATKINSIFRRYLARIAFIPYRDAVRQAKQRQRLMVQHDEFKETKEQDYDDVSCQGLNKSFLSARSIHSGSNGDCFYDKWTDLQIKEAIHNPVPRNEWGKQFALDTDKFKWVIRDGLWVKNYSCASEEE